MLTDVSNQSWISIWIQKILTKQVKSSICFPFWALKLPTFLYFFQAKSPYLTLLQSVLEFVFLLRFFVTIYDNLRVKIETSKSNKIKAKHTQLIFTCLKPTIWTPLTLFWCFYYFTRFSTVSIVNFKQVNGSWRNNSGENLKVQDNNGRNDQ